MEVKSEMMDFLRRIARYDAVVNAEYWQQDARAILNDMAGHLEDPPAMCPVCGAFIRQRYNAQYHVLVAYCVVCDYEDEWDVPDVNPASIRY